LGRRDLLNLDRRTLVSLNRREMVNFIGVCTLCPAQMKKGADYSSTPLHIYFLAGDD
jgi:hypothetical protein